MVMENGLVLPCLCLYNTGHEVNPCWTGSEWVNHQLPPPAVKFNIILLLPSLPPK